MRFEIVLINFPFDDFSGSKLRPALCLTSPISKHQHVILAPITSNLNNATETTDILLENKQNDFEKTGLKVSSVIKIHKLITIPDKIIQKTIGFLPESLHKEVDGKLKLLFNIS